MNELNQIKYLLKDFCKEGYIDNEDRKMLFGLAKRYGIKDKEVEKLIRNELSEVKNLQVEKLFKVLEQPDAAIKVLEDNNPASSRFFPDLINIGGLEMAQYKNNDAFAFIPLTNMAGVCLIQNDHSMDANIMLQNMAVRLALSIPAKKTRFTFVDLAQSGLSFSNLSGLDERLYTLIDSAKKFESIVESLVKESSAFIFKEIGNKYNNYNEYFSKNKSTANPYHIFLISGLGGKMSEELPGNLYRLFSLASKAGLFFLINFEKRTFEFFLDHEPELIKALENHLFMYDLSERKCKSIIPDLDLWYNKIFNINHNAKIEFNNYHIGLINYEFDPVKYPKPVWNDNEVLPLDRPANDSIQNVFLKMGVDDTGEKLDIVIDDIRKNILLLSNGETANNSIFKHLLYLLASEYGPSEIEINCFGLNSDTFRFTQNLTHCSIIVSGKNPVYLEGFMQNLNVELQRRRDLFANAPVSISSYSEYRKISDDSLPRLFVLIQGLDEIISNASDLFSIELIEKLSQLLKDCNNFGIHFLIFIEPEEKILSMDLNQYDYRLFYLSDAAKSKSFANLSIPLCEHLKDPEKVLVFSLSDNKTDICTIKPKDEKSIFEHFSRIPDFSGPQHTEKLILNSFDVPQIGSIPDNQKPISEDGTIDLYIGASQWFTPDTNYKLTLPKNQTPNVMICGNDQKTCHSLLHSMQIQLADVCKITVLDFENQLQSSKMALDRCNILKSNAEFAELFDKFKDLAENSRNNPGVLSPQREVHLLFVVNTDKLMNHPDKNIIFSRLSYLLQNTSETGIRLFVQINDKSAFDDDHLTVFSKYTFGTSIICKGANESLLSSLTLMDYKIGIPEEGGKVLIETVNKRSDFVADPVKLYQIG